VALAAAGVVAVAGAFVGASMLRSASGHDDGTATRAGQPTVWVQQPAETDEGAAAIIDGVVSYDAAAGCFLVDTSTGRFPVVWPAGTRPLDGESGVALADGSLVRPGQTIRGAGAYSSVDHVTDEFDIPDACVPATREVAVFNPNDAIAVDQDP
jgi:hypothetical protein